MTWSHVKTSRQQRLTGNPGVEDLEEPPESPAEGAGMGGQGLEFFWMLLKTTI